ncbi:MAG: hypothetical protein S4CHLAM102_06110 [Chlamydiia bacterium]|nr:hypothetical protein [Chlamydiia bacterium]
MSGSLALRVLFVSFVFLVIPLIFYSFVLYDREYHSKREEIFTSLEILEDDHQQYIRQIERFELDFIDAIHDLVSLQKPSGEVIHDEYIEPILRKFALREKISALFYLEHTVSGELLCQSSTVPSQIGKEYNHIFSVHKLGTRIGQVKFGLDPIFGPSLYFYKVVFHPGSDNVQGMIVASISLNQLLEQLSSFQTIHETNISLLSKSKTVITSTDSALVHQHFLVESTSTEYEKVKPGDVIEQQRDESHTIILEEVPQVSRGYRFKYQGKNNFCVINKIPESSLFLLLSVPVRVVYLEMSHALWQLVVFLLFVLVIGGVVSFFLALRMSRPLRKLTHSMDAVGQGDLDKQFHHDPLGFEINTLGEKFNQMLGSLKYHIEEVKKERSQKESLETEIRLGKKIQEEMLPTISTKEVGLDIATRFATAMQLGGDYYDWEIYGKEEKTVLLAISDGCGKGIFGCFYAFDLRSIIRSMAASNNELETIIHKSNQLFCEDTKENGMFVTLFLALYDVESRRLSYSNLGHLPPLVKRVDGRLEKLDTAGMALGVEPDSQAEIKEIELQVGDLIILYTDGITEAHNAHGNLFGETRLEQLINEADSNEVEYLADKIMQGVRDFVGGAPQHDDMTLVIIKIE